MVSKPIKMYINRTHVRDAFVSSIMHSTRHKNVDVGMVILAKSKRIYLTTILKQAIQLILINLVGPDNFAKFCVVLSCGRKPEYPEKTHLSDLATIVPSHILPGPSIEPRPQRWLAHALDR